MFQKLLESLASALNQCGIDYMIIGGQALLLYGEPRLTKDIDLTLGIGPERLPEILNLVKALGWEVSVESPLEFVQRTMVLPCLDPKSGIRFDFIFSCSPYEQQAMKRVKKVVLGRAEVRFASLEDFLIHKVVAGRPRDMEDIRNVLLKNHQVDFPYISKWLKQFEEAFGQPFLKRLEEIRQNP